MHMQTCTHSVMGDLQLSTYPCCSLQPTGTSTGRGSSLGWAPVPPACSPGADCSVGSRLRCACQRSGCCRVSLQGAHYVLTTAVSKSPSPPPLQIEILLSYFLSSSFLLCFKSLCNSFVAIYSGLWSSTSLTLWALGWFCVFHPDMLCTGTCLS